MTERPRPRRRRNGFMEGPDQIDSLGALYRTALFGSEHASSLARNGLAELAPISWPDPGEDLDDSELSDHERRQAIARERMRREGRA